MIYDAYLIYRLDRFSQVEVLNENLNLSAYVPSHNHKFNISNISKISKYLSDLFMIGYECICICRFFQSVIIQQKMVLVHPVDTVTNITLPTPTTPVGQEWLPVGSQHWAWYLSWGYRSEK